MSNLKQRLVGAWEMIDWKIVSGDQLLDPPLGPVENCGGTLIYSEDGLMSAFLSVKDPVPFNDKHLGGGTLEEKARANSEVTCYTGSYTVDDANSTVIHTVKYASWPNMVGQVLGRICIFEDDDTLKLDTPPIDFGGKKLGSYITWKRASK